MKFFLALYTNWANDFELIENMVLTADRFGFDGALIADHYMYPKDNIAAFRPDYNATLEAWITLAYLASKTERIHLGTLVTPIPLRPPGIVAKMVATLDTLSNGRVIFGVGAGWSQAEFEGYSEWNTPKVRVDKTVEGLDLMIKLWTQDVVTFRGNYYSAKEAVLEPKPVQKPYPKLLFGGHGDRMHRLASRYADIVYDSQWQDVESFRQGKEKVMLAAKKWNRAKQISFMYGGFNLRTLVTPYQPKEYMNRVEAGAEAGASYFATPFPVGEQIDAIKNFAKEIIPSFK